jgi:hypothetical protein
MKRAERILHVGVEDLTTNRMGLAEIPVATIAKLHPLAAMEAAPPGK